jgi:sulfur-carrier protein
MQWNDPDIGSVCSVSKVLLVRLWSFRMAIEVRVPTILRNYTGGEKTVDGKGTTIEELIADLDARHPGLRDRLVDESGLRRFVNVYRNDEDIRFLGGLETPLSDGDVVTVLPAVAGGSVRPTRAGLPR